MIGIVGDELVEVQLSSDRMLEYILTPDNLNRAYKQVKANKGSGGIDRMEVEQLLPYLRAHKEEITESLLGGSCRPNPVRRVESLIHKYLNAGVMVGHKYEDTTEGVPQGGPLSPILSNIMLTELDRELERRGLPFVRYADDCVIFCKSPRAAERVCESIAKFIEGKLFLKVNREKTHVGSVQGQKFLGYSFNM